MENSQMDDSIKRALENFRAEDSMNHWGRMEDMLNDSANADLNESAEDQIIRNKLSEMKPEMPVGHWALMEAQLATMSADGEGELEDMMLDGKAYESLNNLKASYNEEHWPIMEDKLVDAFSWRKKAVRYKFAELAILLLTFVTILQYWPEAKEMLPKIKKHIPTKTTPAVVQTQPLAELSTTKNLDNAQENNQLHAQTQPIATKNSNSSIENNQVVNSVDELVLDNPASNRSTESTQLPPVILSDISLSSKDGKVEKNLTGADSEKGMKTVTDLSNLDFLTSITSEKQQRLEAVPTIPHLQFGPLAAKELPHSTKKIQLGKFLSNSSFRIGMYGLSSIDALDATQTNGELLSQTKAATIGYGTGLAMAFKNGRWELESGIGYMSKSVRPSDLKSKDLQVSLSRREVANTVWTETQYDMINIPVHVRYNAMDRTKWKMYFQSGLSMSINQNIIYRYNQLITSPSSPNLLVPSEQEDQAKAFDATDITRNIGVAEESLSLENTFFNFDVGMGLERAINKRYATFLQTRYSHRLGLDSGIGLEEESAIFRSIQLKAGLKVSLFNKK